MKKLIHILFISIWFCSCTTYLKSSNPLLRDELLDNKFNFLNDTFSNSQDKSFSFWNKVASKKQQTDTFKNSKNQYIILSAVSSKLLRVKLYNNNVLIDSIFIGGLFNDSTFYFNRKRKIDLFFPVLWNYDTDDLKLSIDKEGNLRLNRYGKSILFFTIVPMMAANGNFTETFKRKN